MEIKKRMDSEEVCDLINEGWDIKDILTDGVTIDGSLIMWNDMPDAVVNKLPNNMTVIGDFDLSHSDIEELPHGLRVFGNLDLDHTRITEVPGDLFVGGSLSLAHAPLKNLPDGLSIPGSLNLHESEVTKLPKSLTVCGMLDISCTPITEMPEDLVVGEWLNLYATRIKRMPESLKISPRYGYKIWNHDIINADGVSRLKEGEYVPGRYLYADGILTLVRRRKTFKDYIFYEGRIPGKNVVSDGIYYAHCASFREGIEDIAYKRAKDRGKEQYANLTLDSVLPAQEMITMYRVITGACRQGTEDFVASLGELKPAYSIREAIEITQGEYGSDRFKAFFS